MIYAEQNTYRCCFTGHRPEKISEPEPVIKLKLEQEICRAIADGLNIFISGMARGVDIWAAEIVLKLRDSGVPVQLICASPFDGFENNWNADWQARYRTVMASADNAIFVCPRYSRYCFQVRNEWMVNHSSRVIAVYNGEPGGTRNTIAYANKHGVPVVVI